VKRFLDVIEFNKQELLSFIKLYILFRMRQLFCHCNTVRFALRLIYYQCLVELTSNSQVFLLCTLLFIWLQSLVVLTSKLLLSVYCVVCGCVTSLEMRTKPANLNISKDVVRQLFPINNGNYQIFINYLKIY